MPGIGNGHGNGKYTPQLAEEIASVVAMGTPAKFAAQAHGVSEATFYRWLEEHESFKSAIQKGRARAVQERVEIIRQAALSGKQWTAAAWHLERQYPEHFGLKQPETNIAVKVEIRDCSRDSAPQVEVIECKLIEE